MSRSKQLVFVIMPFADTDHCKSSQWTEFFERQLRPTIEQQGYDCERSSLTHGNLIGSILEKLVRAHVVLADLTDCRPNVLYELGVRHTLSRRTILITQDGSSVPSDLRTYMYHQYVLSSPGSVEELKHFLCSCLADIRQNPSKPDSPVADFLCDRVRVTREEKQHYQLAMELIKRARERLLVVERTPVLLLKNINTEYHQEWHDSLSTWIKRATRNPTVQRCALLFVASKTAAVLSSKRISSQFETRLREYKKLEERPGGGGLIIRAIPQYCGSFVVADDRIGIWYKTETNETGIYLLEMPELANAFETVFFRLAGEVRQSADDIINLVDSFRPVSVSQHHGGRASRQSSGRV